MLQFQSVKISYGGLHPRENKPRKEVNIDKGEIL